ncbi:MAG: hypothetical protein CSA66_07430 [Proteobacteria bacterium]|nr:MAG: hypothetical protein CSA66_07430 [Pseudomonadota bacterium]
MTTTSFSTGTRTGETGTQAAESEHKVIRKMLGDLGGATEFGSIRDIVATLGRMLPEHFASEEGPDGLYDDLRLMQPGLTPKIDALAKDHHGLSSEIAELQAVCQQIEQLQGRLCALKDGFIKHLAEHEAVESGLVADAYYIDLGGAG